MNKTPWDNNIDTYATYNSNISLSENVKREILNEVNNNISNIVNHIYTNKVEKISINELIKTHFNINPKEHSKFYIAFVSCNTDIRLKCYTDTNYITLSRKCDNANIDFNYIAQDVFDEENHIQYTYILDKDDVQNWCKQVGEYNFDNYIKHNKLTPKFKMYQKVYFIDKKLIKIEKCNDELWSILTKEQKCEYYLKKYKDASFIKTGYIVSICVDLQQQKIYYNIAIENNSNIMYGIPEMYIANTNAEAIEIAANNNPSK